MNAQRYASTERTASQFAGAYFQRYVFMTIAIPLLFVLITVMKIVLFPSGFIRTALGIVDRGWPVFEAQYWEVARLVGIQNADNYLAFVSVMLITYVLFLIYVVTALSKNHFDVTSPRFSDFGAILLCSVGGVYAAFFDLPKSDPRPFYNFYVDSFGFFYVRQWTLLLAGGLTPFLAVIVASKLSGQLLALRR